jgi:lactam utilization protein B
MVGSAVGLAKTNTIVMALKKESIQHAAEQRGLKVLQEVFAFSRKEEPA